jgi:SsuE family FMN reductase
MSQTLRAVALGGSPDGRSSRSGALLDRALGLLAERGVTGERIDLASLPAEGLLARSRVAAVEAALDAVLAADVLLVATPIYRATYSGLLKIFFDLLPAGALTGKVAIPIASGGSPNHQLAIDHGLRPLLASVGATVVPSGVYAAPDHNGAVLERLERAVAEAIALVPGAAVHPSSTVPTRKAAMPVHPDRPIAVFHEHPDWFRPLFVELERRGVPYVRLDAHHHRYEPGAGRPPYALVFNRMSPSAWRRGAGHSIFYTAQYLDQLERSGVRVVNGTQAFLTEISKARQLALLDALGLPFPRARVIHDPRQAPAASAGLRFPIVVKPNIGGSGAGVRRFDSPERLSAAVEDGTLELGLDHTGLVQEFLPAADARIVRVETLGGRYLYGIRVYPTGESFDLCPADICRGVDGAELARAACPADAPKNGLRVEGYTPPPEIVHEVERIVAAAGIDVGGVEYLIDARDGKRAYYDINALSNFVADAPRVVGFDAFARLADFLVAEAERVDRASTRPDRTGAGSAAVATRAHASANGASTTPSDETPARTERVA